MDDADYNDDVNEYKECHFRYDTIYILIMLKR